MTTDAFFGQQSPHSAVKARIVSKYFWSWAVLVGKGTRRRDEPLRYLDLFCGRGRYDDGSSSTPLMVLQQVIDNPSFSNLVEAHLSDVKPQFCEALAAELRSMPGLDKLRRAPLVRIREVDDELTREFEATHLPPTLSFVDPWGYKGLSVRLIRALTKDWGCDCVFFFNYNRINTHISNPVLVKQMDHLFGQELAHDLRVRLKGLPPKTREKEILNTLKGAIAEDGKRQLFDFAFEFERWDRTSHYLILVTKHRLGRKIMMDIAAKESTKAPQGVPSFAYRNVVPAPEVTTQQLLLLPPPPPITPLDVLREALLKHFAGRSITLHEMRLEFDRMNERYVDRNYKDVLLDLEAKETITVNPPASARPSRNGKPTFGEQVRVTFPRRSD